MRTSETIEHIAPALASAQGAISDPEMRGEGKVGKDGRRTYPYALLTDVLRVARSALAAEGIVVIQSIDLSRDAMVTRLLHSSGEWIEGDYPIARNNDPQKQGSANTYARRYALMTTLGIAGERDDDGERAAKGTTEGEAHTEGARVGRAWFARQLLAPARAGYSGPGFAAALKTARAEAEWIPASLDHIKIWCLWLGKDKPSRMQAAQRDGVIRWLRSDKGRASWEAFEKECGPIKSPKKAKRKAPKKDPVSKWSGHSAIKSPHHIEKQDREAFALRCLELDFSASEVARWCQAHKRDHPEAMSADTRAKLLEWLADTAEGQGADIVCAWLDENPQKTEGDQNATP